MATHSYIVTLTYEMDIDAETAMKWEDWLQADEVTVSRVPGHSVVLTIPVVGYDLEKAPSVALQHVSSVLRDEPVALEVLAEAEYYRRAAEPTLPEVVSAPEVAELLGGISRQRVHQLRESAAFPAPLFELRTGPIWDRRAIERFAREWARKPGRPAAAAAASSG